MTIHAETQIALRAAADPPSRRRPDRVVLGLVVLVVVLRLAFLTAPIGSDEAGYLLVAGQWHPGGTSLYGDYWVDRPPLLLTLYGVAAHLGGLTALRLLGCAAAAVVVAAVAGTARQLGGAQSARWAAGLAAALAASPLMGAVPVDGELLAAPFVAVSFAAAVRASLTPLAPTARWSAAVAGASAVAALLVKQNLADGLVFASACWGLAALRGRSDLRRLLLLLRYAAGGGIATLVVVGWWTWLHGTSLGGVFAATYPFRLRAAQVIATTPHPQDGVRLHHLLVAALVSGLPLLVLLLVTALLRRRVGGPAGFALATTSAFTAVSVLSGGSYWLHYLVEAIVPLSVAGGLLVARRVQGARPLLACMLVVAAGAWAWGATEHVDAPGPAVGAAVAAASRTSDTVVSAFGDSDVVAASGLTSPYPYLWSLPSHTLDPRLTLLRGVLGGARPPTWVVVRGRQTDAYVREHAGTAFSGSYHDVGRVCGRRIYLRDGVHRSVPHAVAGCGAVLSWLRPAAGWIDAAAPAATSAPGRR